MSIIEKKTKQFIANSIFPSLFFACFGFALLQVGAVRVHGSLGLHAFFSIPGLTLLGLILFRARLHWAAQGENKSLIRACDLKGYVLLLIAGIGIGLVTLASSVIAVLIISTLMYLFPWAKLSICRRHFHKSAMIIFAGAVVGVFVYDVQIEPLSFMIVGWILYVLSMSMHISVLMSLDRGYRVGEKNSEKSELDTHVSVV